MPTHPHTTARAPATGADSPSTDYTSDAWNRRKDEALAHAADLRREAMDDFWRGTNAWLHQGVDHAARAARRLQKRLGRHRHHRHVSTQQVAGV